MKYETCTFCDGKGYIVRFDSSSQKKEERCSKCDGTGKVEKDNVVEKIAIEVAKNIDYVFLGKAFIPLGRRIIESFKRLKGK